MDTGPGVLSPGRENHGGCVEVVFAPEGRGEGPLTEDERGIFETFLDQRSSLLALALSAVQRSSVDGAPAKSGDPGEGQTLNKVYLHPILREGRLYVGFSFEDPKGDIEHGLGVLLNGERVVEVGGADTAFLLWIAERDLRES